MIATLIGAGYVAACTLYCVWMWSRMLRRVEARYRPPARRPAQAIRWDVFGPAGERVIPAGPVCAACGTQRGPLAASWSGGIHGAMFCLDVAQCRRRRGIRPGTITPRGQR